ncbi:jg18182 [Pararge aegeria aegeria]|uniref:Jg18182 protein n=1 Tax=Pararge aegeria aegeria TaxID=348720 RepID=A0A8S4RDM0_9NEOP|nr:jg18182 [Pararge aegeria aegeria]
METSHLKRSSITKGQMPTETNDNRYKGRLRFSVTYKKDRKFEFPKLNLGKRAPGRPRKKWFDDIRERPDIPIRY